MKYINGLLIFLKAWLIAKSFLINILLSKYFIKNLRSSSKNSSIYKTKQTLGYRF